MKGKNKISYRTDFHEMSKFIFIPSQIRNTFFIVFEIVLYGTRLMKIAQK